MATTHKQIITHISEGSFLPPWKPLQLPWMILHS